MIPHGRYTYAKASDTAQDTMCEYPQSDHALPHWKFYCDVMMTIHVSIFLTKKQIISIQKQHPQFGFAFIASLHVVVLMVEFHLKTIKYVICVNNNLR